MSHVTYPVFNGTNPRNWITDIEIAFTANNIGADAHLRKIGLAVLHSGIAKQWYAALNPKPDTWTRANGADGYKELFLTKYANDANRTQASQQAYLRMQRVGESVDQYYNALQENWTEIGAANAMPEWTKINKFINGLIPAIRQRVMEAAPATLAAAVTIATNCYNAFQANIQPTHVATDTAIETLTAAMQELVAATQNIQNNNNSGRPENNNDERDNRPRNNFPPRRRQNFNNTRCFYCGNLGHRIAECRQLKYQREQEKRRQPWKRDSDQQGKGQPR